MLVRGFGFMHVVSRLRRVMAMVIVLLSLLGLLAGLGVASANAADAPVLTGGGVVRPLA